MHFDLLQRDGALGFRSAVVVGHGGRRLHRDQSKRAEIDARAGAQTLGGLQRLGETVLQNHTVGRNAIRMLGHPTHVLHQSHALVAVRFGRHGTVRHGIDERIELRGERVATVAVQVADDRVAEFQFLGGVLERRNLIILAIPQVDKREGRNIKTFEALDVERVAPCQIRIVAPRGSAGHDDGCGRPLRVVFAAGYVKPLLRACVGTITGFDDDHVMQCAGHFHGNQRRNADGHVGERAAVHVHRRAVHGLRLGWLHGVAEDAGDTPQVNEFAEGHGLAILRAGDHLGNALGDLIHGTRQHNDLHELAGRGEHHTLSHVALSTVHCDLAQGTGRHFGDARYEDGVQLAVVNSLLRKGDQQVLGGLDGSHFTAQTPVDQLRVGQGGLAAARRATLGTGCGDAHARLAQHGCRVDATFAQRIDQRNRGGGLALTAGRLQRGVGGDEDDLAMLARRIRIVLQVIEIAERINLLHQAVLAGEILNAGHWSPFLKPSARRRRAPNMAGTTQISNILVNERQQ